VVGLRRTFPLDLAGLTVALGAIATLYGGFRAFYFQVGFLESFSYYSDERPLNEIVNGWIGRDPSETLVGIHAFGDYLLLNVWSQFPNPWDQPGGVNYLPPVLLFYKLLGYLPYTFGLYLFLFAIVICLILPMVIASRGRPLLQRALLVTTLAVVTGPAVATLDRANNQGFLPLLLFGFGLAVLKQRWGWASALLAVAMTIKVYPLILVLVLVALRKYRWALLSVSLSVLAILCALPFTTSAGFGGIPLIIENILQFQDKSVQQFLQYNVSFTGGLANVAMLLGLTGIGTWIASNALIIVFLYGVAVIPLLWWNRIPLWMRIILAFSFTTALMPITYPYALNWALAGSALAVWVAGRQETTEFLSRNLTLALAGSLALVTAVLPVLIPGSAEAGRAAGVVSLAACATAILLPLCAIFAGRGSREGRLTLT